MGWAFGLVMTLSIGAVLAAALPVGPRNRVIGPLWDLSGIARTFTPIVGTLAGFSVASTIFIANLSVTRDAPGFPSLIGMFVVAFVIFVGAAQEFGMTPNLAVSTGEAYDRMQRIAYLLSMFGYFIALAVSWNALRILLLTLGLDAIADVFTWVLLFAVVAGSLRLSIQHMYVLSGIPRSTCVAVPLIGLGVGMAFRLLLVPAVPVLAPPANEPFAVAVACFAIAAAGFALQSVVLSTPDVPAAAAFVERHASRLLTAMLATVAAIVGLLWAVVAIA